MNEFSKQLTALMKQYADGVDDAIAAGLSTVAEEALRSVRRESPKRTGAYKRGWSLDKSRKSGNIAFVVYNRKHYRLTHLLEKGHKTMKKSGKYGEKSFTRANDHIAKAAEQAEAAAMKAVEKAVKG